MVFLDQLQTDLAVGNLANFMFVGPNQVNSMAQSPCANRGRSGHRAFACKHRNDNRP